MSFQIVLLIVGLLTLRLLPYKYLPNLCYLMKRVLLQIDSSFHGSPAGGKSVIYDFDCIEDAQRFLNKIADEVKNNTQNTRSGRKRRNDKKNKRWSKAKNCPSVLSWKTTPPTLNNDSVATPSKETAVEHAAGAECDQERTDKSETATPFDSNADTMAHGSGSEDQDESTDFPDVKIGALKNKSKSSAENEPRIELASSADHFRSALSTILSTESEREEEYSVQDLFLVEQLLFEATAYCVQLRMDAQHRNEDRVHVTEGSDVAKLARFVKRHWRAG